MYVLKFRGAGQGPKALIAELVAGEIGRALGLAVPEIVFVELDPDLARTEPDQEIQDLIRASAGLNLALDYLPGSVTFDPVAEKVDADPYRDYSEPWFGTHKVLRGGAWMTRSRLLRNTWRNFYQPDRRDVWAGFRTCALEP